MYGFSKLPTPTCSWEERSDSTCSVDSNLSSYSSTSAFSLEDECHHIPTYYVNGPLFPSAAKLIAACSPSIPKTGSTPAVPGAGMIEHLYFLDKFCDQTRSLLAAAQQQTEASASISAFLPSAQRLGCGAKEEQLEFRSRSPEATVVQSDPNLSTNNINDNDLLSRSPSKNYFYRSKLELDLMIKNSSLKSSKLADAAAKAEEQRIENQGCLLEQDGVEVNWASGRVEDDSSQLFNMEIELEMPHFKEDNEDTDDSNQGIIMKIMGSVIANKTIPVPVCHRLSSEVENKVVDKLPAVVNIESSSTPSVTSTKVEAVLATDAEDSSRLLKLKTLCELKKTSGVDKDDSNSNNLDIAIQSPTSLENETAQEDAHHSLPNKVENKVMDKLPVDVSIKPSSAPSVECIKVSTRDHSIRPLWSNRIKLLACNALEEAVEEGVVETVQHMDDTSLAESSKDQSNDEDDDNHDMQSKDDLILIACIPKVPSTDRPGPALEGDGYSMGGYHSACNMREEVEESLKSMSERSNDKEGKSSPDDLPLPGDKSAALPTKSRNNRAATPFSKALTLSSTDFYRHIMGDRNGNQNKIGDMESPLPPQHSSRNDTTTTGALAGEIAMASSKEEAFDSSVEVVAEAITLDDDKGTESRYHAAISFSDALALSSAEFYRHIRCDRNGNKDDSVDITSHLPPRSSSNGTTTTGAPADEIGMTSSKEETVSKTDSVAENTASNSSQQTICLATSSSLSSFDGFKDKNNYSTSLSPLTWTIQNMRMCATPAHEDCEDNDTVDVTAKDTMNVLCHEKSNQNDTLPMAIQLDALIEDDPLRNQDDTPLIPKKWQSGQPQQQPQSSALKMKVYRYRKVMSTTSANTTANNSVVMEPHIATTTTTTTTTSPKDVSPTSEETAADDIESDSEPSVRDYQRRCALFPTPLSSPKDISSTPEDAAADDIEADSEPSFRDYQRRCALFPTASSSPKDISQTSEDAAADDIEADSETSVRDCQRCALFPTPSCRTTPTRTTMTSPVLVSLLDNEDVDGDQLRDYTPVVHRKQHQQYSWSRQNRLNIPWNRLSKMEKTHITQYQTQDNDDDDDNNDERSLEPSPPSCTHSLFQFRQLHTSSKAYAQLYA